MRLSFLLCRSAGCLAALVCLCAALPLRAGETELVNAQAPWRIYLCFARTSQKRKSTEMEVTFSSPPPTGWTRPDYDDSCWGRYQDDLFEIMGGYGAPVDIGGRGTTWPALLCLRTCFGISDPAQAKDVKVTITCIGGAVVHVNGTEVGRPFMPQGKLEPLTPAAKYPAEVYTTDDGSTPLPYVRWPPAEKWKERYEKRARTVTLSVPPGALVKGRNVLAVELHQAEVGGPLGRGPAWSHVGILDAKATSTSGAGVISYAEAAKGPRVWSANTVDQVVETLSEKSLLRRSFFHCVMWPRGQPVKGVRMGNPFDPVLPVKMVAPRNGTCSGQTVLSDPSGLRGVSAKLGTWKGPGGAALPAQATRIRFAIQDGDVHYCDDLVERPPDGPKTLPVWLTVQVPKDQAPGWYASLLQLQANGKSFSVPVQLLVSGFSVCEAKDFRSQISIIQSPDAVAARYKVEPWSPGHFKFLERSFEMLGQLGNDVIYVPVAFPSQLSHKTGLIQWVKTGAGYRPDFTAFEKYLDTYLKYCAPPLAMSLFVWDAGSATEVANAYEGRQIPNQPSTPKNPVKVTLRNAQTGALSEFEAPRLGQDGSEAFWKPMLDGVRDIVKKRGWSERIIMLGCGGDTRPSQKTGEILRQWAPYARWNIFSHFSADPGSMFCKDTAGKEALKAGKMVAIGGLEVGLKEWPSQCSGAATVAQLQERARQAKEYLELSNFRWMWAEWSPPMYYRALGLMQLRFTRVGLDFWDDGPRGGKVQGSVPVRTAACGPDGAIPTVRFQLLREGVQDVEAKMALLDALPKLPADRQQALTKLLDELCHRIGTGDAWLSQMELSLDWPGYVARLYSAAAELAGGKPDPGWDQPPQ